MGDRRNIIVKGNGMGIAIYTHWTGYRAEQDIAIALYHGVTRWDDFGYLTRIVFDTVARDDSRNEVTGYGIYPLRPNGISPMEPNPGYDPVINIDNQTVTVNSTTLPFQEFIDNHLPED